MDIRYAPDLLDEVVTRELLRRDAAGDVAWLKEFHRRTDPFFRLESAAARETAFERTHAECFRRLEFAAPLERVVAEFPGVCGAVAALVVERAEGPGGEEADLLVPASVASGTARVVRLRLQTSRFEDAAALEGFLRHELWHVSDMLDPAFGYRPAGRLAERPAEENLVRSRLRLLWNLSVAGAIERVGRTGAATRDGWWRTARRVYPFFPEAHLSAVVRTFRGGRPHYDDLLRLARRPDALLARAGVGEGKADGGAAPGAPCPLCGFPTYGWAPSPVRLPDAVRNGITVDFPSWTPDQGVCRQCVSAYAPAPASV